MCSYDISTICAETIMSGTQTTRRLLLLFTYHRMQYCSFVGLEGLVEYSECPIIRLGFRKFSNKRMTKKSNQTKPLKPSKPPKRLLIVLHF